MAVIDHNGQCAPVFAERVSPGENELFFVSWGQYLDAGESIVSSAWEAGEGVDITGQAVNQSVTDASGVSHSASNVVRLMFSTQPQGRRTIKNSITTTAGRRSLVRGFQVIVDDCN